MRKGGKYGRWRNGSLNERLNGLRNFCVGANRSKMRREKVRSDERGSMRGEGMGSRRSDEDKVGGGIGGDVGGEWECHKCGKEKYEK